MQAPTDPTTHSPNMLDRLAALHRHGLPKPKVPPVFMAHRALGTRNTNPWLGDKSVRGCLVVCEGLVR